eukprot:gene11120-23237_t
MSTDDRYCSFNMVALAASTGVLWGMQFITGDPTSIDYGETDLVVHTLLYSVDIPRKEVTNEDNVELVNELQGSLQSAVDILNDLLVYESLEKEDL